MCPENANLGFDELVVQLMSGVGQNLLDAQRVAEIFRQLNLSVNHQLSKANLKDVSIFTVIITQNNSTQYTGITKIQIPECDEAEASRPPCGRVLHHHHFGHLAKLGKILADTLKVHSWLLDRTISSDFTNHFQLS